MLDIVITQDLSVREGGAGTYAKVGHVVQEDVDLDDLAHVGAGGLEDGLQVLADLPGLLLDRALAVVAVLVDGQLTRAVDGMRGLDGRGLGARSVNARPVHVIHPSLSRNGHVQWARKLVWHATLALCHAPGSFFPTYGSRARCW